MNLIPVEKVDAEDLRWGLLAQAILRLRRRQNPPGDLLHVLAASALPHLMALDAVAHTEEEIPEAAQRLGEKLRRRWRVSTPPPAIATREPSGKVVWVGLAPRDARIWENDMPPAAAIILHDTDLLSRPETGEVLKRLRRGDRVLMVHFDTARGWIRVVAGKEDEKRVGWVQALDVLPVEMLEMSENDLRAFLKRSYLEEKVGEILAFRRSWLREEKSPGV